jgi:hypothetical protein
MALIIFLEAIFGGAPEDVTGALLWKDGHFF